MKTKPIILILLLISNSFLLFGQKSWTLEECINHAMENNLEVKSKLLRSEISGQYKNQTLYNFLPGFDAALDLNIRHGLDYNYYTSQYQDMDNTSSTVYARGELIVFNGLKRINERDQRNYEFKQSRFEVEGYKHDLTLEIVRQYLQILYDTELLEVMKEQLTTDDIQLKTAEKRLELGSASQADYLDIKAQHAKSKANLVETKNRVELSTLSLAQLLELDDSISFNISLPVSDLLAGKPALDEENLLKTAFETYPHLKAKEMYMKSREKNLYKEYGSFSPTISLYGRVYSRFSDMAISFSVMPGTTYPDFGYSDQFDENLARDFGLSLNIPLFSRMQNYTNVRVARIDLQMARVSVEQTKLELNKTLRQSLADAKATFENYESLNASAKAYNEAYKQAQKRFELGMISASEYGIAKTNSLKASADLLHAKYNYILKSKILDFYRGVPISL